MVTLKVLKMILVMRVNQYFTFSKLVKEVFFTDHAVLDIIIFRFNFGLKNAF